jgi:hypothetical protein
MVHDQADLLESWRKVSEINLFAVYGCQMAVLTVFTWNACSIDEFCNLSPPRLDLRHHVSYKMI